MAKYHCSHVLKGVVIRLCFSKGSEASRGCLVSDTTIAPWFSPLEVMAPLVSYRFVHGAECRASCGPILVAAVV